MTDDGGRGRSATGPSVETRTQDAPELDDRPADDRPAAVATPPAEETSATEPVTPQRRSRGRRVLAVLAVLLLLAVATGAGVLVRHLWLTTEAWEGRADLYLDEAQEIGTELAATRGTLEGTRSELEAVRAQLATAQARIVELADEKAQLGDDREVQRQLVDYQARVSEAGGRVALALDQCVQGQQQLIGYLEAQVTGTAAYDPEELTAFRQDVEALCQAASEANISLQRELSR